MAVSTGMNGNSQADDEFSTDFADPDSYITVNGDGSVDLNGVLKEVDEQEAKKRLRSRKYVDVDKAFKDYISRHKGIASDRREDLDKPADLSHMTRTQVTALYWAMGKRIHGNSALKVNGKLRRPLIGNPRDLKQPHHAIEHDGAASVGRSHVL